MIVTKMAIGIRNNAYWSTNMGTATKYPITSDDYWYGLQLAHLQNSSYRLKGTNGHNGGINDVWDSNINQNLGGQVPIGATAEQNDNWNTTYKQYDINTDAFKESQEKEFTKDKKVVNISLKNSIKNDGWNAFKGSFINQQFFPAVSKVQTLRNIKNYPQYADGTSLTSKYGYYANVFAAAKTFKNILWASPFTCEGLFDVQAIYHKAKGLNLPTKNLGRGRESIQNIIWTFSKQTDTFPESQFQKYLQGSTAILNKYSSLSDASKDLINVNKKTMGVHYAKNIVSQVVKGDTTWGALVPGTSKSDNAKQAYYNNGYTEAMFGETLKQTYSAQKSGDANYFKHYYTYGTALRSSLSAAINWYTSILNFTKNSKSNWGSAFAKDMVINGTDGSTTASGPKPHSGPKPDPTSSDIMSSEYSYSYTARNGFSTAYQITPAENSQSFINNVSNQLKSFQSAKYQKIKAQVKTTLDDIQKHEPGVSFTGDNRIIFELPIRTYKKTAAERKSLENMRETLNNLDPRIHVAAQVAFSRAPITNDPVVKISHEKFDKSYTNTWTDQTLPRLMALRSPTQSNYIRHNIPNTLTGLGGFLNDMLNFNQFGTLTGFSQMMNPDFTAPTTGNIYNLYYWVTHEFITTWEAAKKKIIKTPAIWAGIPSSVIRGKIKKAFTETYIKDFSKVNSQSLLGTSANGKNYSAFTAITDNKLTDPKNQAIFNGVFSRLLTNVSRALIIDMKANKTTDEIKHILAGIDSFFGRSLGWMGRRSDNDKALPVTLQKTWYKVPKSGLGVEFFSDGYVNV